MVGGEMEYQLNLMKDEDDERDFQFKSLHNVGEEVEFRVSLEKHNQFFEGTDICTICGKHHYTEVHDHLASVGDGIIDWAGHMSPVKNQGRLGSCVGFAVAAMKEFQEQREHTIEAQAGKTYERKEDHYDLSEAWVYWNSKKIDPWPDSEGTSIRCAMKVLYKIGIPCEAGWEYNDTFKGEPESWAHLIAKWGLIDSYWRISSLNELKVALRSGPVVIGIGCYEEIFNPLHGVVPYPANPDRLLGGHAICAVGFSDSTKLVKFKNSWSENWGSGGYGFISYEYVNDFMWDAWVAKDLNVTKKILEDRGDDKLV